ncbi:ABC transporter permease [Novosphingobium sp. 9U]|nr:ABC transporter permease [Novosphingobium sp. 9U]
MSSGSPRAERLSLFAAAFVIARRDFMAILFSRSFFFFLLGPLFPLLVAGLAGGVGEKLNDSMRRPQLGVAMAAPDLDAALRAQTALASQLGDGVPPMLVLKRLAPGETFDPRAALTQGGHADVAAVLTGTLAHPVLTGTKEQIADWAGPVSLVAAAAVHGVPGPAPQVALQSTASSGASEHKGQMMTAQAAQTLLFLLTMLLAGMVLSNLVEEKGNKVIEILAAAIPMDAVFFGKLFAMLGISFVGIAVWGGAAGLFTLATGGSFAALPAPAVGWSALVALGVLYFAMAYLLLGSVFLAIGSLAATVREVQTLSMPATMMQLVVFFLATYAMTQPGSPAEIFAIVFPFSSPFAMLARAAQEPGLGQHVLAIGWQALCVLVMVRAGSKLFRKRVMKSGPASLKRRGLFAWARRART